MLSFVQNHRKQLIATGLVTLVFGYFILNGPLLQLKKGLHFETELTAFSKPKFVDELEANQFSGFITEVETAGFGHSLILDYEKPVVKTSHIILEKEHQKKSSFDVKLLLEHAKKIKNNAGTFEIDTKTEFPFVLIKEEAGTEVYFETQYLPHSIKGYAGPINVGIFLQSDGKLKSVHHISSSETESYLQKIATADFYRQFSKIKLDAKNEVDGVSGATLTTAAISETVSESVKTMAEHSLESHVDLSSVFNFSVATVFSKIWILHVVVIAGLLWFGLQKQSLKKSKKLVLYVRLFSVCYIGFYLNNSFTFTAILHPFLGTSLSVMVSIYLALVLVGAIWGKNVYCKYVCPFGNAQCLVLQASPKTWRAEFFVSSTVLKWIRVCISIVLIAGILVGQDRWKNFELFPDLFGLDYLSFWFFVAVLFVVLSVKYPMLWCRSLCPTGWLLDSVQVLTQNKNVFTPLKKVNQKVASVFVLFFAVLFYSPEVHAQKELLVLEKTSALAIPNAHVNVTDESGTTKTFLTDWDGKLRIKYHENVKLDVYSLGFQKQIIAFKADSNLGFSKKIFLEEEIQTLNEVVITAQFSENSTEKAVHKIKIIDKKRIEQQGAVTLKDVLEFENNIRISQDNILGSGMSMQGVEGQNVKILVDGVPVIGRLDGNIDLSQINMNQVERIEIVEGPLSVNYGTDALAGTINIITKKNQSKSFEGSFKSYYESVGQYNFSGDLGYKFKKQRVSFSGLRNYFDGWSPVDTSRFQQWKPKLQYSAKGLYQYLGEKNTLRFSSEVFQETITNKGQPRTPYFETAFDDLYKTKRWNNALSWHSYLSFSKELDVLVAYNYYNRQKNTFFRDLTTMEKTLTQNAEDQDTTQFHLAMSRATYSILPDSSRVSYQVGYDLNNEISIGKKILNGKQSLGDYALFANSELKITKALVARVGIRYAYNTAYKSPVIPSLNLKYGLKSMVFRISYARGFRAPSLKELYFNFVDFNHNIQGSPELSAETSHNFQGSAVWQKQISTQTLFKFETTTFYNSIQNKISLVQIENSTSYRYLNVNQFKTLGASLNFTVSYNHLKLTLGTSYIGRQNQVVDSLQAPEFSYSPELRANFLYEWHKLGLSVSCFYKFNGAVPRFYSEDNVLKSGTTSAYQLADLVFTKSLWKKKVSLSGGIKNLFNVMQVASSAGGSAHSDGGNSMSVAWGRSYFVSALINF